ncbi:MAG: SURF1 family protein [Actinomycetes bacterium]
MSKVREPYAFFKTLVALALILLCLVAAQWQYHRGVDRHARNSMIQNHISLPAVTLDSVKNTPLAFEWQTVTSKGEFNPTEQILLRNRYNDGVYGFEVLTLFTTSKNEKFWVDRGWVKAGATATTAPTITSPPVSTVSITGRLRLDTSLPRGSFFALPTNGKGLISKLNAQSQLQTENYYIDLLRGSESSLTPTVTAQLPEWSDGPHMAYALQWLFFAGLVVYGRILIRRTR